MNKNEEILDSTTINPFIQTEDIPSTNTQQDQGEGGESTNGAPTHIDRPTHPLLSILNKNKEEKNEEKKIEEKNEEKKNSIERPKNPFLTTLNHPKRPNPFAMSMNNNNNNIDNNNNIFAQLKLKKKKNKKNEPKKLGEILPTPEVSRQLTATELMRLLDTVRLHKPLPEERRNLGINETIERLNLHNLTHMMMACGGSKGISFLTDDIRLMQSLSKELREQFYKVESYFSSMSNEAKKHKLTEEVINKLKQNHQNDNKKEEGNERGEGNGDKEKRGNNNNDAMEEDDSPLLIMEPIQYRNQFQQHTEEYMNLLKRLIDLINKKHETLEEGIKKRKDSIKETLEAKKENYDETANAVLSIPLYLDVLIKMYNREVRANENLGITLLDSIGRFSAFLSSCFYNPSLIKPNEIPHLLYLLRLSIDTLENTKRNTQFYHNTLHLSDDDLIKYFKTKTQRYWAKRFYLFLKHVREIRTCPKKEKDIDQYINTWL